MIGFFIFVVVGSSARRRRRRHTHARRRRPPSHAPPRRARPQHVLDDPVARQGQVDLLEGRTPPMMGGGVAKSMTSETPPRARAPPAASATSAASRSAKTTRGVATRWPESGHGRRSNAGGRSWLLAATVAATRPTAPVALHVSTDAEDAPPPTTLQPERPLTPPSPQRARGTARRSRCRPTRVARSSRALRRRSTPPSPTPSSSSTGLHRADLHHACLEFEAALGEGSGACTLMGALYALADDFSSQPPSSTTVATVRLSAHTHELSCAFLGTACEITTATLVVEAPGGRATVDGGGASWGFTVADAGALELRNLALANFANAGGGAAVYVGSGADATLDDVQVQDCDGGDDPTADFGGALLVAGEDGGTRGGRAVLRNAALRRNRARAPAAPPLSGRARRSPPTARYSRRTRRSTRAVRSSRWATSPWRTPTSRPTARTSAAPSPSRPAPTPRSTAAGSSRTCARPAASSTPPSPPPSR